MLPQVSALADFIGSSRRLLILTGAGISTESNIPDYRSAMGAYSSGYKPMTHQARADTDGYGRISALPVSGLLVDGFGMCEGLTRVPLIRSSWRARRTDDGTGAAAESRPAAATRLRPHKQSCAAPPPPPPLPTPRVTH